MGNYQTQLKERAAKYIQERDEKIRNFLPTLERLLNESGISNNQIREISSKTATDLVKLLNNQEITSKQLVQIFTYRSMTVGKLLNLITEFDYENAIQLAQKCDAQRKKTKKKNWTFEDQWDLQQFFPPLYGVPISVKDLFDMKGMASTIGITQRVFIKKQKDNPIITCLRTSGMIPFVKSNIPQLCFTFQTNNFLWGRAQNIWNRHRTVGGSSGGEAGLLSANCSPIGIGNDIGGSVRIPAQFCGIYSLKLSNNRLSQCQTFWTRALYGKKNILPVIGPMGKSADDLALWLKATTNQQFYNGENSVYNKLHLFDENVYLKTQKTSKLRIGYFTNLNLIQSTLASQRAIIQVKNTLQSLGHELIQIQLPYQDQIIKSFYSQMTAQGKSRLFMDLVGNQEIIPQVAQLIKITQVSPIVYTLIKNIFKIFQPRTALIMEAMKEKTTYQYFINGGMMEFYRQKVIEFWKQNKLDFIICPGFGSQALRHGFAKQTSLAVAYTFIWNVLNLPSGSMPITVVKNDEQVYQSRYDDMITKVLKQSARGSVGLPVGIQIIGLPYQQQKILGLMKIIESWVKFSENYQPPQM